MNIVNIPSSNLDDVWSLVKKDISEALSFSGNHTDAKFVYNTVKEKKMQLWVIWDKSKPTTIEKYFGVVVTEIVERKLKIPHSYPLKGAVMYPYEINKGSRVIRRPGCPFAHGRDQA